MPNMIKTPMVELKKTAAVSLAKHGLEADGEGGIKVRLVLDHSWSMQPWYRAGAVQRLTEQVLGLASALDDDGAIEVWYFGDGVSDVQVLSLHKSTSVPAQAPSGRRGLFGRRGAPESTVDPYYVGWVDRTHALQPWGSTNYVAGIKAPVDYRHAEKETEPSLVIFQTDGYPNSQPATVKALQDVSGDDTFFAFVGFGEPEGQDMAFLRSLDTVGGRVRDNASALIVGGINDFATLPDSVVYDSVLKEFVGEWLPQVL